MRRYFIGIARQEQIASLTGVLKDIVSSEKAKDSRYGTGETLQRVLAVTCGV